MDEILDILNEQGKIIGRALRSECHANRELLHGVVHLHIFDKEGRLFLQKRGKNKNLLPGYWDAGVGGHIASGESPETALIREAVEEIGVDAEKAEFLYNYIWECPREREYVYAYKLVYKGSLTTKTDEVDDGAYFTLNEIEKQIGKGFLTPNFEFEYRNYLKKKINS